VAQLAARREVSILATVLLAALVGCSPPGPPPGPTPVPVPPSIRTVAGRGVAIEGRGSVDTEEVSPQYEGGLTVGIDVVTLTHDGQSSFIVTAVQGQERENLTRAIGVYRGQRPLVVQGPVSFQVQADGPWTIRIQPMSSGGSPAFSGSGDAVSAYFNPPPPTSWNLSHAGKSGFFVFAHCLGDSIVVEDRSGVIDDTELVEFPRGPCFWEVRADGAWSLKPQP
jgi:hypothetical protein